MSSPDVSATVTEFTFGVRLGMVFIVEASCISATAVTTLLLYLGYSAIKSRSTTKKWTFETDVHYYLLNLLVSDLMQAIGGILNVKWVVDSAVTEGALCTAQGALKQSGDVGVALTSLAIAIHTFVILVFRWSPPRILALLVMSAIWVFVILVVGISFATHKHQVYYGDTQYWCWIRQRYHVQQIVLEYLWMWIAAFVNTIIYVFLALIIKGFVSIDGSKVRLHVRKKKIDKTTPVFGDRDASENIALRMLFYPAVYIITVLPIAIFRFKAFSGSTVPFAATSFADTLFCSSGILNVLLYSFTRPRLLPRNRSQVPSRYSWYRQATRRQELGQLPNDSADHWTISATEERRGPSGLSAVEEERFKSHSDWNLAPIDPLFIPRGKHRVEADYRQPDGQ